MLRYISTYVTLVHADDVLSLLQTSSVRRSGKTPPEDVESGVPADCKPKLIGENKQCVRKGAYAMRTAGYSKKADDYWGTNKGLNSALDGSGEGVLYAWTQALRASESCTTKFQLTDHGAVWLVSYSSESTMRGHGSDLCDELEDKPGSFVFDAAQDPACGVSELADKNECSLHQHMLKEGCEPKLVAERTACAKQDNAGNNGQSRVKMGVKGSPTECMELWAAGADCCGARIDWDPVSGECGCASRAHGCLSRWDNCPKEDGGASWFCQDELMQETAICGNWVPVKTLNVYDFSSCINPFLHDCPHSGVKKVKVKKTPEEKEECKANKESLKAAKAKRKTAKAALKAARGELKAARQEIKAITEAMSDC